MQLEILTPADDPNLGGGFFFRVSFEESERNGLASAVWLADASPSSVLDFAIQDLNLLLVAWDGTTPPPDAMRAAEVAFPLVAVLTDESVELHEDATPTPDRLRILEALQQGLTEADWGKLAEWQRFACWRQAEETDPETMEPAFIEIVETGPVRVQFCSFFWMPELTVRIGEDVWQIEDIYWIEAPGADVVVELACLADSLEPERELTAAELDALLDNPDEGFDEDSSQLKLHWNCTTGEVKESHRHKTEVTVDEMMSKIVAAMPELPGRFFRRHALMVRIVELERERLSKVTQADPVRSYLANVPLGYFPEPFSSPKPILHPAPKVGRNDPCPCGSGKKSKKCCGG